MLSKARLKERLERTVGDTVRSKHTRPFFDEDPGLILDVGSGGIPKGDVNLDIDRSWWNYLKKVGISIPNFVIGDATALPFKEGSFSVVVSSDVLEHINEDEIAMSEMRRAALAGRIVLHIPNKDQVHIISFKGVVYVSDGKGGQREIRWGEDQKDHKRVGYTEAELKEKLGKAGFSTIEISPTFDIVEALAWEFDSLAVYESLAQGKDPHVATVIPMRKENFSNAVKKMLNFTPADFRNLGWRVLAK